MTNDERKEIVRTFLEECWGEGELELLEMLVADDFVGRIHTRLVQRDDLAQLITNDQKVPDFAINVGKMVAEGPRVAVHFGFQGTRAVGPRPFQSTKKLSIGGLAIFELEGSKIKTAIIITDVFEFERQIGPIGLWEAVRRYGGW